MDAFLSRMNSTIIQWRTYLASLNGDTLVLRAQATARCLEFEIANLNAPVVHEIGESSPAIMEISDSE
jgi:hypothetical protein